MAFRQPTAIPQRHLPPINTDSQTPRAHLSPLDRPIDDTQEWVLFSPSQAQTASILSAERTPRTTGYSRLSDFGSWTVARSGQDDDAGQPDNEEDADELDSLDDGLHAFREPPQPRNQPGRIDQSGGSILPAHDGLGTFIASAAQVQEQLYSYEKYNTGRKQGYGHHRTASSVQRRLDALEDDPEEGVFLDDARRARIEKWRVDSSQMMIEEIQKEKKAAKTQKADPIISDLNLPGDALKDIPASEDESLWQRITRRVIKDLIGIDEDTLAVILGESLAEEDPLTKTPTQSFQHSYIQEQPKQEDFTWEERLIRRLAQELGTLAQYLTGSSSSREAPQSATMDYAGIPIAPTSTYTSTTNVDSTHVPFRPTMQSRRAPTTSRLARRPSITDTRSDPIETVSETEYWERTPDLKTVLSYLSQRFMSSRRYSSHSASQSSAIATTHTEDSLNRAAIIRQHHPLMARSQQRGRRRGSFRLSTQLNKRDAGLGSVVSGASLKRAGTSCASWSTKRHKRGTSDASRNYWDIGYGSLGSEGAALGTWGEV